ncbi:hypothetical protein [Xenorhabdus sp. TS4]|nr:hypothetical protein [Xenorhabdus sp. TS4]MBC8949213.1 hypothetical protein [Xenorhabdus sp. TS4]
MRVFSDVHNPYEAVRRYMYILLVRHFGYALVKCRNNGNTAGYVTALVIGYYYGTTDNTYGRITFMFKTDKNNPGKAIMTNYNYDDIKGQAAFSLLQTALLTGQKMEIQCNGEWVTGIWVGEGAGQTVDKGFP